jgi:hypothetical protein
MTSAEPWTIGDEGYPLLLQTGETEGDGKTPLLDRQHPHDLFMELAGTYSRRLTPDLSVFAYVGFPGEPALGPPAFMHRFSGMENPEAPIGHHWMDSSHITYGVLTGGIVRGDFKLEASAFRGREPDEDRTDFDSPKLDSLSIRASWNPTPRWSFQASAGRLESPEQTEPAVDVDRLTASATYHRSWERAEWGTTLAWGQNAADPGENLDAYLLESAIAIDERHTIFARVERVEKDELFPPADPLSEKSFGVGKASLGYVFDFLRRGEFRIGVGGVGSLAILPDSLDPVYGSDPTSVTAFVRARIG